MIEGMIDKKTVQKTHFGGFGDESEEEDEDEVSSDFKPHATFLTVFQPERKKTKAEVMAEVIAKSKEHKVRVHLNHVIVGKGSNHFQFRSCDKLSKNKTMSYGMSSTKRWTLCGHCFTRQRHRRQRLTIQKLHWNLLSR